MSSPPKKVSFRDGTERRTCSVNARRNSVGGCDDPSARIGGDRDASVPGRGGRVAGAGTKATTNAKAGHAARGGVRQSVVGGHCTAGQDRRRSPTGTASTENSVRPCRKDTVTAAPRNPKAAVTRNSPKTVPGFSVQAYQKGTVTAAPKRPEPIASSGGSPSALSSFAAMYGRAGFPMEAVYSETGRSGGRWFRWLLPLENVDYEWFMPVLADGLRDRPRPYGGCASQGLWDLVDRDDSGLRVLSALPRLVFPLRRALEVGARDWTVVVRALKTIHKLMAAGSDGLVGRALVPYFKHLLPSIGRHIKAKWSKASDGLNLYVTYNITDLCNATLSLMELNGGECALVNIKFVIPTYENTEVQCSGDVISTERGQPVTLLAPRSTFSYRPMPLCDVHA